MQFPFGWIQKHVIKSDHLLLDSAPNIVPLISRLEFDKIQKLLKQKL